MCFLFLILLLIFSPALSKKGKKCRYKRDCRWYEVCSNFGKCVEKKHFHCHNHAECKMFGGIKCSKKKKRDKLGVCLFKKSSSGVVADAIHDVEEMGDDMFNKLPTLPDYSTNSNDYRDDSSFEEEFHHLHKSRTSNRRSIKGNCALNRICGDPKFRDKFISNKTYVANINFLVIKTDNWWKMSHQGIAAISKQLKDVYSKAGFSFNSKIFAYGLQNIAKTAGVKDWKNLKDFRTHKYGCHCHQGKKSLGGGFYKCDDYEHTCISAEDLIILLQGKDWQQKGAIQMLIVDFHNSRRLGFGKFPWSRLHGMLAFAKHVCRKGQTTIQHELGHVFGLLHVFRGQAHNKCGPCAEHKASDFSGDLISDTPPSPQHWECTLKTVNDKMTNSCGEGAWKKLPLGNIMNYGPCRTLLTVQQIARMKCFQAHSFKHKFSKYVGEGFVIDKNQKYVPPKDE